MISVKKLKQNLPYKISVELFARLGKCVYINLESASIDYFAGIYFQRTSGCTPAVWMT